MIAVLVKEAALVTQVAQAMVPVVVIVPPVMGLVVAIEVTVPVPVTVWNVGSDPDPFEVNTCPDVPAAVDVGAVPAPPPITTP